MKTELVNLPPFVWISVFHYYENAFKLPGTVIYTAGKLSEEYAYLKKNGIKDWKMDVSIEAFCLTE